MKERAAAKSIEVVRLNERQAPAREPDEVALEEPLEIQVEGRSIAVLMRTPGHDRELAAGFALTESIIRSAEDIFEIITCPTTERPGNSVNIILRDPEQFDPKQLSRNFLSSSSCGICGKSSIEAAIQQFPPVSAAPLINAHTLLQLPAKLTAAQETFQRTGGLHACALFDRHGELLLLREDVGRHNALDKLIGHQLLVKQLPSGNCVLLLSGRVSFEMTQKALAAGIAIIAAISAPTSLAVEFARANNQTLVGFLRGETMNVYAGTVG
ncbi:MAG TPA: formate dehydrogenase accessory sulfurtransferase FdhD [Chthoniobacterales bacterium]|jgi:FdhD protein